MQFNYVVVPVFYVIYDIQLSRKAANFFSFYNKTAKIVEEIVNFEAISIRILGIAELLFLTARD